jgi:hypothetical protein
MLKVLGYSILSPPWVCPDELFSNRLFVGRFIVSGQVVDDKISQSAPITHNRNYSAILATLQITSYALGV